MKLSRAVRQYHSSVVSGVVKYANLLQSRSTQMKMGFDLY